MANPLVSIIIPTYNTAHYLPTAITSCLAQTYQDVEIIVVDDGSPDDTLAAIQGFPHVRYVRKVNGGVASARNRGLQEARGSLIQFLDADDMLLPAKIQRCVEALLIRPTVHIVYTDHEKRTLDLNSPYISTRPAESWGIVQGSTEQTLPVLLRSISANVWLQSALIRREILDQVGGFNERLKGTDDWYLFVNLAAHGAEFFHIPECLLWLRIRPDSQSRQKITFSEAKLFAWEDLRLLPIPKVYLDAIDLEAQIAGRHHVLARALWNDGQAVAARQHFRNAIKLHRHGRTGRRILLLLTYLVPRNLADRLMKSLLQLRKGILHKPSDISARSESA